MVPTFLKIRTASLLNIVTDFLDEYEQETTLEQTTTTGTTTTTTADEGENAEPTFNEIGDMILDKTGTNPRIHENHPPKHENSNRSGLPECERFPDTLIGRILPDTSLEIDWDTIENTVSDGLLPGGCWEPTLMDSE